MARSFLVLLAAFLAAGCAAAGQAGSLKSAPAFSAIDAYHLILQDKPRLEAAEQRLIAGCMTKKGIKYVLPPPSSQLGRTLTETLPTSVAEHIGYPQLQATPLSAADRYLQSLAPDAQLRYRVALVGEAGDTTSITVNGSKVAMPNSGCQTAAETAIYGDRKKRAPLDILVFNLTGQRQFSTLGDEELAKATSLWSTCMRTQSEQFNSPADAISEAASVAKTSGTSSSGRPRSIAVLDATCRAATNWDGANADASERALVRAANTFSTQLHQYRDLQIAALSRLTASK